MPKAGNSGGTSFTNPAPGGVEGRTDQGGDWSNIRGNIVAVASGTITKIYQGLSGFGTTVIERLQSGQYVYYAGESGAGAPVVSQGQQVSQGQAIAPGLGSGGIEVGYWNPNTGRALGAPQYTGEGVATPAGTEFRRNIGSGITRAPSAAQPKTPITRPGGGSTNSGSGNADGVKSLLTGYTSLRDMPRTAPPGTKNPTKWFLASFTGKWNQFAAANTSPSAPPSGSGEGPAASRVVGSVTTAMLQKVGAAHGWSGQQIDDWMKVIDAESGGNPNAVNRSSGAFGIGQMLAPGGSPSNLAPNIAKYSAYGGNGSSVLGQLTGMGNYIAQTYGNPSAAWAHEQSQHWY